MKYILPVLLFFFTLTPNQVQAVIPDNYLVVGSGEIRYLGFIEVYEATLYSPMAVKKDDLLNASSSRCLQLNYYVDLKSEDFIEAANTVLAKQHDPEVLSPVQGEIDSLHNSYRDVSSGDTYTLCYSAGREETQLILNEEVLVTIQSAEFARLYFGIWLGEKNAISDKLRKNLIAGLPQ